MRYVLIAIFSIVFSFKLISSDTTSENFSGDGFTTSSFNKSNWFLFFSGGAMLPRTDIFSNNNFVDFSNIELKGCFGLGYNYTSWLSQRIEGGFASYNSNSLALGLSSSGDLIEGNTTLNINLNNLFGKSKVRRFWVNIYGGIGIAYYRANIKTYELGMPSIIIDEIAKNNRKEITTFPVGGEINYTASQSVNFYLGFRHTYTSTDRLELFEKNDNDSYESLNFGVSFTFGKGGLNNMKKGKWNFKSIPEILEKKGEKVNYKISITFPPKQFAKNAVLKVEPMLVYDDDKKLFLDTVYIGGKNVLKADYIVDGKGREIVLEGQFDFANDMRSSRLLVKQSLYRFNNKIFDQKKLGRSIKNDFPNSKIADGIRVTRDRYRKASVFKMIDEGGKAQQDNNNRLILNFERNSTKLKYSERYPNEKSVINEIANRINACNKNPVKFIIKSYASPEGQNNANMVLSERRSAKALSLLAKSPGVQYRVQFYTSLKNIELTNKLFETVPDPSFYFHDNTFKYTSGKFETNKEAAKHCELIRKKGFSDAFIAVFKVDTDNEIVMRTENGFLTSDMIEKIINKGADWNGLDSLLSEGSSKYAVELFEEFQTQREEDRLSVLNNYYRDQRNGFENEILSNLRKTEILFDCKQQKRSYTKKDLLNAFRNNSQEMSLQKIFSQIVEQLKFEDQVEILNYILENNPYDEIVLINSASIYANNGMFTEAKNLLNRIQSSNYGEYWYNKALLEIEGKKLDVASHYLKKASKCGIDISYEELILKITGLDNKHTQINQNIEEHFIYNSALLLVLENELIKASELLDKTSDHSGDVFYLKAIINARLGKKKEFVYNLSQAILRNESYAIEAKTDVEFLDYRESKEFNSLLNMSN